MSSGKQQAYDLTLKWAFTAVLLCTSVAQAATSMRCGGRIVGEGDYTAELLSACGEPALRDPPASNAPSANGYAVDTERWTYDFGPNLLLRLVTLRNGQIAEIETDGYGFAKGVPSSPCSPHALTEGLSKYRLLHKCGSPLTRRAENAFRPTTERVEIYRNTDPQPYRNQYVIPIFREEWVYNFGRNTPLQRVILEDGWITHVESLSAGFNR